MKLRNKITGEIGELCGVKRIVVYAVGTNKILGEYDTLNELTKDWEDYKPKDPLITDEKIRKAVRAWAEANGIEFMDIIDDSTIKDCGSNHIEFLGSPFKGLVKKPYYIDDQCGSEE